MGFPARFDHLLDKYKILMLSLFTEGYQPRSSVSKSPKDNYLRTNAQLSVQRVIDYWTANIHDVHSNHPLVQAIKHLGAWDQNPVELYEIADGRAPYVAKNFKFTTDFNRGSFKALSIYSTANSMIYASSDYIRPYVAVDSWKSLRPLDCLWLDSDIMDMSIPSNEKKSDQLLSAVKVDLPMLSLMYKGFKHYLARTSDAARYGAEEFVATYVLPSLIKTQADITAVSGLISIYEGTYEKNSRVDLNYFVPSYGNEFADVAKYTLNRITDTRMPYLQILQNIPVIYEENAQRALILPNYAPTTQVDWAMFATRLRVINFLLDVGGKAGQKANQGFINQLKGYVRDIRSSGIPFNAMTDDMAALYENSLTRYNRL